MESKKIIEKENKKTKREIMKKIIIPKINHSKRFLVDLATIIMSNTVAEDVCKSGLYKNTLKGFCKHTLDVVAWWDRKFYYDDEGVLKIGNHIATFKFAGELCTSSNEVKIFFLAKLIEDFRDKKRVHKKKFAPVFIHDVCKRNELTKLIELLQPAIEIAAVGADDSVFEKADKIAVGWVAHTDNTMLTLQ